MSTAWNWPGSRWWRVDLHTHSPASYDFGGEQDRAQPDWSRWVETVRDAGIQAVAVTDHNTAEGIEPLLQAAGQVSEAPVIFPGVELTANDGTHLLLVVGPDCNEQHIDELLSKAEISVDQRGRQDARSRLSVEELLDLDCDRGLVIVGAHVNRPNGLLVHDGQQRIKELCHPRLAGAEVDPAGMSDLTWLDGRRTEVARAIPQLWCSDSHAFDQPGRRFTWVKMTKPDLQGLRLALLDGAGSLQLKAKESPGDPNRHASYVIENITVQKAKYMGRPNPFVVTFNPWLNALIGGRGTGKSTLVDFCRVALRREGELNGGGDSSLRAAFDKRMRVPASRAEEGLLTADTVVEVTYRRDGERFVLAWDEQGRTSPIARLAEDRRVPEEGDVRERFPIRIYSQKQLFDLAKDPNALFLVIDDTGAVRGAELARSRKEAETKYLSLCAEARSLRTQATELPTRRAALDDVRRKIEILQQGGHAETLNEYRLRRGQDDTWTEVQISVHDGVAALTRAADALVVTAIDDRGDGSPSFVALKRAHEQIRGAVLELQKTVQAAVEKARRQLDAAAAGPDAAIWRDAVAASERKYQNVTAQLAEAGIANPDEYRGLLERAAILEREIHTLEQRRVAADERDSEAAVELGSYRDLRAELTRRRTLFAASASTELIRVEIRGCAERGDCETFLRDTLGIDRFDEDYRAIVRRIAPTAATPSAWSYQYLDALVDELRALLADPKKQWRIEDRRFETALRRLQPERLDRLGLYAPEDAVDVSFRDPRDGANQWRTLSQGSPGQQTAALLAFVLGYGDEPIILDQPEDDLDSTLIYELLVRRLRDSKQSRQIIVVTHNPNIVVHGDAELVVSLEAVSGQTRIPFSGGLQEQKARDEICRVMEGGREAFATRYRRIMHFGANERG
jgi:energy-coupling factor transporter ATP-binding protein EcfA2